MSLDPTLTKHILTETMSMMPTILSPIAPLPVTPGITKEMELQNHESLTITIVYDNIKYDQRLISSWGFSALIEYRREISLFDTGGDGPTLIENMRLLGIDPTLIERVILSHAHGDHTGGLSSLLEIGSRPIVFLIPSFSDSFKHELKQVTSVVEVTPGQSITEGLFTTGEMGRNIAEQALIIKTEQGMVLITGCAHPGIIEIVEQAQEMFNEPVLLVMGGFHLSSKNKTQISSILQEFRRLGVIKVAPSHCTGEEAISLFAAEYRENFVPSGVGKVITLDSLEQQ